MSESAALAGRRVLVTRAGAAGALLAGRLRAHGAEPVVRPTIAIVPPDDPGPLDAALGRLAEFDWLVCTSASAVEAIFARVGRPGGRLARPARLRVAAVGRATAAAFRAMGWRVDLVSPGGGAAGLVGALGEVGGLCILVPASEIALPTLPEGLRAGGASVTVPVAYRTITVPPLADEPAVGLLRAGAIDAATFTSPSAVQGFLPLLTLAGAARRPPASVCIGPTTAAAARAAGLPVAAVASAPGADGLLAALCAHFGGAVPPVPKGA